VWRNLFVIRRRGTWYLNDAFACSRRIKASYSERHEHCSALADAISCNRQKTGAVTSHSKDRGNKTITGISDRFYGFDSNVILSGQVPSMHIGEDAVPECDMVGVSRPLLNIVFLWLKSRRHSMAICISILLLPIGRPGRWLLTALKTCKRSRLTSLMFFLRIKQCDLQSHWKVKQQHNQKSGKLSA